MANKPLKSLTFTDLPDTYTIPDSVIWVTYGTTTKAEIDVALSNDLFVCCKYSNTIYYLSDKHTRAGIGTTYTFVGMTTTDGTYTGPQIKYLKLEYSSLNSSETWSNDTLIVPDLATTTPSALGTAAAGTSKKASRADHVHPKPTASDIGAISAPVSASNGQFLMWNGSAWVASSLPTYNGEVS